MSARAPQDPGRSRWRSQVGASTLEYAIMVALVLFALSLLVFASIEVAEAAVGSAGLG
jgi:Flp pilus assembly protein TadG